MKKRIVFLGSKSIGYSCLNFLIEKSAELDLEIAGVLTKENKELSKSTESLSQLCATHKIPLIADLTEMLKLKDIAFLVSVQYHKILNQEEIDLASEMAINLHMAPLPDYRGCNQFSFAIIDQAREFGTTIHQMSTKIDGGAILFEKRFPLQPETWVSDLYAETVAASFELFQTSLPKLVQGEYSLTPQSSFSRSRPSSFHLRKEMAEIKALSLEWPKSKIARYIRATYFPPFPPPYFMIGDQKVEISLVEDESA